MARNVGEVKPSQNIGITYMKSLLSAREVSPGSRPDFEQETTVAPDISSRELPGTRALEAGFGWPAPAGRSPVFGSDSSGFMMSQLG